MIRKAAIYMIVIAACLMACTLPGAPEPTGLNLEGAPTGQTISGQPANKAAPKATIVVQATTESNAPAAPIMPLGAEAGSAEVLSEVAVQDLAERLQVSASEVTVKSIVPHTFNDSSLGVRQPGMMYMQVLTPGYIITLEADGAAYTYHGAGAKVIYAGATVPTSSSKRPMPSTLPSRQQGDLITVYLIHTDRSTGDCSVVFPMTRATDDALMAEGGLVAGELALRSLFSGVKEDERAMGYESVFSLATADALISVTTQGDTAYVNLRDIRDLVDLDDTCARIQLQQQLLRTLQGVLPIEHVLGALDGDPEDWCEWLNLPCDTSQGNCDPSPFMPTRIPLRQVVPTIPPKPAPVLDLAEALPDEAEVVRQASWDMDQDGAEEVVVLVGQPAQSEAMSYDWLKLMVVLPGPEPQVLWQMRTMGTRATALDLQDVNGDGQLEVLSLQSMGASGQTLYLLTWRGGSYDVLRPQGGYFAGWDSFGEKGVGFEDVDGDGVDEILAAYGPAASKRDVYQWDGQTYVYLVTQDYAAQ